MKREDLLLSLLYAPDNSKGINEPVEGSIKLLKMIFLIQEATKESFYRFVPYDLGPSSFEVYEDIVKLKDKNLILEETLRKNIKSYKLTQGGILIARDLFNNLNHNLKDEIIKIKKEFNNFPTSKIILHVYRFYPQFTRNSLIKPF